MLVRDYKEGEDRKEGEDGRQKDGPAKAFNPNTTKITRHFRKRCEIFTITEE